MNALEANLLDRSISGLSDTLLANRQMDARAKEAAVRAALERESLGLRREDMSDARENRRLSLEAQKAHQERLEKIGSEANATKRNQMYLDFLSDLNKTGQLTDDGLARMEDAFNQQFGAAGLGVKLFRVAPQKTPTPYKSPSGTDYTTFGNSILRDYDPRANVTMERDESTGELRPKTVRQRMTLEALDADMERRARQTMEQTAGGPTPQEQREMDEILTRPEIPAGGSVRGLTSAVSPAGVPTVASQADFDKLPRGAKYINAKDGKTYTKP